MTLRDYVLVAFARAWQEEQGAARVDPAVVEVVRSDPRFDPEADDEDLLLLYAEHLVELRLDDDDGHGTAAAVRGALGAAGVLVPVIGLLAGGALLGAALPPPELRPVSVFQFIAEGIVLPGVFLLWTTVLTRLLVPWLGRLHWAAWLLALLRGRAGDTRMGRLTGRVLRTSGVAGPLFAGYSHRFWTASLVVFLGLGLWRFVFTDHLFAWSSTLSFTGDEVERLFRFLVAPLDWIPGVDPPSAEQVRLSEYGSLSLAGETGGAYVQASADPLADQALRKAWYLPLLVSVAFWGLLPRLVAWGLAERAIRRGVRDGLDDPTSSLILSALRPGLETSASPPAQVPQAPPPREEAPSAPADAASRAGRGLDLVVFAAETPSAAVLERLRLARLGVSERVHAIATDDDDPAMDAAVAWLASTEGPEGAIVVYDVADIPDGLKAEFLGRVAGALGDDAPLHVLLVGSDAFRASPRGARIDARIAAWSELASRAGVPPEQVHTDGASP